MKQEAIKVRTGLVAVGEASLLKAQGRVVACQNCSASVYRSFESVLIEVLGAAGPLSEYLLSGPARCPNCARPIVENTLVRCEGEREQDTPNATQDSASYGDETNVVLIDEALLSEAQAFISGCQHCDGNAEMTFDYVLDAMMAECDPSITEYVMCRPAKCPRCDQEITEKTLVVGGDPPTVS